LVKKIVKAHGYENIYYSRGRFLTINLVPGCKVYNEEIFRADGKEYRVWNPYRSKIAAALHRGMHIPIDLGRRVLYLGGASGTTVSHVSDVIGVEGIVYVVEIAHRPFRDLVRKVARYRKNVVPILEDARRPSRYAWALEEVDVVYCDVAQPDQTNILLRNSELFLQEGGYVCIALKARSIDSTANPKVIFREEERKIAERGFKVLKSVRLEPFEEGHSMILAVKRK